MIIIAGILATIFLFLTIRAVWVLISVNKFATFWTQQNTISPQASSYRLVALGDSTVQGVGASSAMQGFVGQLSRRIEKQLTRPVQIHNFSKSGATIADLSRQEASAATQLQNADLIIIAIGPNDLTHHESLGSYRSKYQQVLSTLPTNKVIIASIPPLQRAHIPLSTIQTWNTALNDLAKHSNAKVAPVFDAIFPHRNDPRIYAGDFFHPSNHGYSLWADAFAKEITLKK